MCIYIYIYRERERIYIYIYIYIYRQERSTESCLESSVSRVVMRERRRAHIRWLCAHEHKAQREPLFGEKLTSFESVES